MGEVVRYHHGLTIRHFRQLQGTTQEELAAIWPRSDGSQGVNVRYIQDIEYGNKHVENPAVLRKIAGFLRIPVWRFGLSEYDPFNPLALPGHGHTMYTETLDTAESLIRQVWSLRCAARIVEAERGVKRLNDLFTYFREQLPPPARLEQQFQLLAVQVHRLNAVTALENKDYNQALALYQEMCTLTESLDNPAVRALALKGYGKELERQGHKQQAVALLEDARDVSLRSSKRLIAFVHSYLSRCYASAGDELRFERAIDTGLRLARSLNPAEDGTDFVYSWSGVSAMLAEQSWGYLALSQPQKTLAMRAQITEALIQGQDDRVFAWIPLDWARAYLALGEVEASVAEIKEFHRRVTVMQSLHAQRQSYTLLRELERAGYGAVPAVAELRERLAE